MQNWLKLLMGVLMLGVGGFLVYAGGLVAWEGWQGRPPERTGGDPVTRNKAEYIPLSTGLESPVGQKMVAQGSGTERVEVATDSIEALRRKHGVRSLTELEADLEFSRMPAGSYGFIGTAWLDYLIRGEEGPSVRREQMSGFEIHKLNNGETLMVGFVSRETALRLQAGSGKVEALLFTEPWEEAKQPVGVFLSNLEKARAYAFRSGSRIEIVVKSKQ